LIRTHHSTVKHHALTPSGDAYSLSLSMRYS